MCFLRKFWKTMVFAENRGPNPPLVWGLESPPHTRSWRRMGSVVDCKSSIMLLCVWRPSRIARFPSFQRQVDYGDVRCCLGIWFELSFAYSVWNTNTRQVFRYSAILTPKSCNDNFSSCWVAPLSRRSPTFEGNSGGIDASVSHSFIWWARAIAKRERVAIQHGVTEKRVIVKWNREF